jgi:uncharacterized protein with GYD domain
MPRPAADPEVVGQAGGQVRFERRRASGAFRRRCAVATYIMLANWTDQGIKSAKESPRRLDAAKQVLKDLGGEFKSFYLTMGDYDIIAVLEAPDDATVAKFIPQTGMLGNIRTRTLKAFPEDAYRQLLSSMR